MTRLAAGSRCRSRKCAAVPARRTKALVVTRRSSLRVDRCLLTRGRTRRAVATSRTAPSGELSPWPAVLARSRPMGTRRRSRTTAPLLYDGGRQRTTLRRAILYHCAAHGLRRRTSARRASARRADDGDVGLVAPLFSSAAEEEGRGRLGGLSGPPTSEVQKGPLLAPAMLW